MEEEISSLGTLNTVIILLNCSYLKLSVPIFIDINYGAPIVRQHIEKSMLLTEEFLDIL